MRLTGWVKMVSHKTGTALKPTLESWVISTMRDRCPTCVDIETNLGREIGEYQHKLMEVANNFNEDKIEQFNERLDAIGGMREGLISRLNNLTNMVGTVKS